MEKLLAEIDRVGKRAVEMDDDAALCELEWIERRMLDRLRCYRQKVTSRIYGRSSKVKAGPL